MVPVGVPVVPAPLESPEIDKPAALPGVTQLALAVRFVPDPPAEQAGRLQVDAANDDDAAKASATAVREWATLLNVIDFILFNSSVVLAGETGPDV